MTRADLARLALLGAIWGASFLFVRIVSPAIGPLLTADLRMLVAGVALMAAVLLGERGGTQLSAGLILLPFAAFSPPAAGPTPFIVVCVLALGLVCGALAYLIYFRLIYDVGPAGALTPLPISCRSSACSGAPSFPARRSRRPCWPARR